MPLSNVIRADIRAIIPASGAVALFLGNDQKVFLIYADSTVGEAISAHLRGVVPARPSTHDLMANLMRAMGVKVERVVITSLEEQTFHARIILTVENEVQERKIVELDARPSDSIALAVRMEAPLYVSKAVWDAVEDRSELLKSINTEGEDASGAGE